MQRSLKLVTAVSRNIAGRAERIRKSIKLGRVREFVSSINTVFVAETMIDSRRPLIEIEMTRGGGNKVRRPISIRRGIEREKTRPLLAPHRLRNLISRKRS